MKYVKKYEYVILEDETRQVCILNTLSLKNCLFGVGEVREAERGIIPEPKTESEKKESFYYLERLFQKKEEYLLKRDRREHIKEENKYYNLLISNPQYRPQGWDMKTNKRVVGIIQGNPEEYKEYRDHLNFKYFDSWKDAYTQLELKQ